MSSPEQAETATTRRVLARRVTELDTLVLDDGTQKRIVAIESIGYGDQPEKTTIYAGMDILHFWYDEKVTVLRD